MPPAVPTTDRSGIDRTSGTIATPVLQGLAIGSKESGLSANHDGGASFNHIAYMTIERVVMYGGGFMAARVAVRGSVHVFTLGTISQTRYPTPPPATGPVAWTYMPSNTYDSSLGANVFQDYNDDGATLVCSGTAADLFQGGTCTIYLGTDGSKTEFRMPSVPYVLNLRNWWAGYDTKDNVAYAWPTKTTLADGEILSYNYVGYADWDYESGNRPAPTKWNSVESSLGFRVYISGATPTGTTNPGALRSPGPLATAQVGDLFAINTSAEYADPLTLGRTFGAGSMSSMLTRSGSASTLINNGVPTVTATYSPAGITVSSPSGASVIYEGITSFGPFVTNYGQSGSSSGTPSTPANSFPFLSFNVKRGAATTSYSINVDQTTFPENYKGTVSNPDGSTEYFKVMYGLLRQTTDGLVRETHYSYSGQEGHYYGIAGYARLTRLQSIQLPDGGSQSFSYEHGGISGSTLAPAGGGTTLDTEVELPASCTVDNYRICNKPIYIRDPKDNQTDFTYDPAHGGVLTETLPADANGVRPQKRYTYSLLYPKVLNASGALVNSTPVWRLTRISECRIATVADPASCVGTAAEKVTTYAYNNNNLFRTSETVATGDGLLSATTSYTYDYRGDVMSIDGPRADVDDRSYFTYNALRQKVFEIGADPDGTGPLPRPITRHVYDVDGRESQTESGTGTATDGADFVVDRYVRRTFDPNTNQISREEVVVP
jgi:hypothetical protein